MASGCPYTWVRSFFRKSSTNDPNAPASELRVRVVRNHEIRVDVTLPAKSARWLIDLIPDDVMTKIREEKIPIDQIQDDLASAERLDKGAIFHLEEEHRNVQVWLE